MLDAMLTNMPLPGELVAEKYRIERVLGKGGMGVVFAATHVHLQQRVALKLLLPAAAGDPEAVERFLREGRAAVKIRNEHVARVFDVGEMADRSPFIVMEYLEGSDFGEILEGEMQLPIAQAVDYILEACEAVAEAHSLKIVHRDLKPSNLFLARRPNGSSTVKVLDFGISKMLEPGLAMTRTASMMGSPLYMSPEQLKSARDVDERADIWSIGVILYQLIAGAPPFVAGSLPELCAVVLSHQTPWLDRAVPAVPVELARIVATCLRSNVSERYVNLADFADAVARFGTKNAAISAQRIVEQLGLPEKRTVPVTRPAAEDGAASEATSMAARLSTSARVAPLSTTRSSWSAASAAKGRGARSFLSRRNVVGGVALLSMVGIGDALLRRAPEKNAPSVQAPIGAAMLPAGTATATAATATAATTTLPSPALLGPATSATGAPASSGANTSRSPGPPTVVGSPSHAASNPRRPPPPAVTVGGPTPLAAGPAPVTPAPTALPATTPSAAPTVSAKAPLGAATSSKD